MEATGSWEQAVLQQHSVAIKTQEKIGVGLCCVAGSNEMCHLLHMEALEVFPTSRSKKEVIWNHGAFSTHDSHWDPNQPGNWSQHCSLKDHHFEPGTKGTKMSSKLKDCNGKVGWYEGYEKYMHWSRESMKTCRVKVLAGAIRGSTAL